MQHVVLAHLYAGHETENRVFENEHEGGGEGSQAGEQEGRRFVEQQRYRADGQHNPQYTFGYIQQSAQRQVALVLVDVVVVESEIEHGSEGYAQGHQTVDAHNAENPEAHAVGALEGERHQRKKYQRRNNLAHFAQGVPLQQFQTYGYFAHFHQLAHTHEDNLLYYPGHGEGHDAYRHKIDYFLGGAVSPHTESVEGIVDCCQQPVGDRV